MQDKAGITGKVIARVFGPDGKLKAESIHHNIITVQGDGLIADMFLTPPTQVKFDAAHSYIVVGTGYGSVGTPKNQTWVFTQAGTPQPMTAGYPQLSGAFPNGVLTYAVSFPASSFSSVTLNEAAIVNGTTSGTAKCLAYAQISPSIPITSLDTLSITWAVTFLGS